MLRKIFIRKGRPLAPVLPLMQQRYHHLATRLLFLVFDLVLPQVCFYFSRPFGASCYNSEALPARSSMRREGPYLRSRSGGRVGKISLAPHPGPLLGRESNFSVNQVEQHQVCSMGEAFKRIALEKRQRRARIKRASDH